MTSATERLDSYLTALSEFPVYLAHNANVDAMVSVDDDLAATVGTPADEPPEGALDSPGELSRRLANAMARGDGDLVAMTDDFGRWLEAHLEPEETRLGGQAAIMADLMSVAGADPLLYTYLLTARQRSLFTDPEAIDFPTVEEGELRVRPVSEVENADRTKINWIFEFEEGGTFHGARAATDSRFIAAARPDRVNLETGLEPVVEHLAERVECALLSGYHSLKTEYADGTTYADRVDRGRSFVSKLKRASDVPVQIEYGVTHKDHLRAALIERIVPEVDAIGLDTRELGLLAADLGLDGWTHQDVLGDEAGTDGVDDLDAVATYDLIERVRAELGIDCVKLHQKHYFAAVTSGSYVPPDATRRGWDFASIVAAAKGRSGTIDDVSDLEAGVEVPYSERGRQAVEGLADHLDLAVEHGSIATEEVVVTPNRVVDDPDGTVGLGDSISVANFALEQALATKKEQSVAH